MSAKYEVVISGMSGEFPDCRGVLKFKTKLFQGENFITWDNRKWPMEYKYKFGDEVVPIGTGKYENTNRYDAIVFQVNPMLARSSDVINKKLLEPAFEAIIDAGMSPVDMSGANTGVYMSCSYSEAENIHAFDRYMGQNMFLIGSSKTMLANRLSFAFNLKGPSFAFYSSWQGGMEALTMAYKHISEGTVESALVGVSSSIIDPKLSIHFLRLGLLSPDGLCRALSADANGYGRSESSVILFLQRSCQAKRNYGTVLFSDTYYCGSSTNTILHYDEEIIKKSFDAIYANAKDVKPSDVSFIEMDAPGVQRLDKVEANAVAEIFCKNRKGPLPVGSVKSNVGHTEASAALVSIVKALIALDSDEIPPNLHFSKPNMDIKAFRDGKLKVISEKTKLPGPVIAVNSFGLNGILAHTVLKQFPRKPKDKKELISDPLPRLVLLQGRNDEQLAEKLIMLESMPLNTDYISLVNDVFRPPLLTHIFRAYTVLPHTDKTANKTDILTKDTRPVWFVFSGMGSQWNGMGDGLLDIPIFAETIAKCDAVLKKKNVDIYEILQSKDEKLFDKIGNAFIGIAAIQIALVDILKAIGVVPDGIIGHSLGETGCAYADGCFTLEQTLLCAYYRGVASVEVETTRGMMAAIGKGYDQIKDSLPDGIEVACHNSLNSCTLTGPAKLVDDFVGKLKEQGVFAKSVNVANMAYHSKHISPAGPILQKYLKKVIPHPKTRSSKWFSTSVPESDWDSDLAKFCSAEYHTNNLVSSVLFEEGCRHIPKNAILVEIAPHGLLQAILKRAFTQAVNIPLTLQSQKGNAVNYLLSAIGNMFVAGVNLDINAIYPKIQYPVPRETPGLSHLATWDHSVQFGNLEPLKDAPLSHEVLKVQINQGSTFNYLTGHQAKDKIVIPPSFYMYLTWYIWSTVKCEKMGKSPIVFENLKIHKYLVITPEKWRNFTVLIQPGSGAFQVMLEKEKEEKSILVMSGLIYTPFEQLKIKNEAVPPKIVDFVLDSAQFYDRLHEVGYQMSGVFQNVKQLDFNDDGLFGRLTWNDNWVGFLDSLMKIYVYGDMKSKDLVYPKRIRRIAISSPDFASLKNGDEVLIHKHPITKRLSCEGLEMMDFVCEPLVYAHKGPKLEIRPFRFISHSNPRLQNLSSFLKFCLEIIVENLPTMTFSSNGKLSVPEVAPSQMSNALKQVIDGDPLLKAKVKVCSLKEILSHGGDHQCVLVLIEDDDQRYKINMLTTNNTKNLFVLTVGTQLPFEKSFAQLTAQSFQNKNIILYKKISNSTGLPPISIVENDWKERYALSCKNKKPTPAIFIRKDVDVSDMNLIFSKSIQYPQIRWMFIMDDNAIPFNISQELYKSHLAKDLSVGVLKNGEWGTYHSIEDDIVGNLSDASLETISANIRLHRTDVRFFNYEYIRENAITEDDQRTICVEYSGVRDNIHSVMGLTTCIQGRESIPESRFKWPIPKGWSMEDAATVPFAYAQAYYVLFIVPLRLNTKSVFIQGGPRKFLFANACVALALAKKFVVYVTVCDENEKRAMKRNHPQLEETHILSCANTEYDLNLRVLTKGDGTDIVVNCIPGAEHQLAALNCASVFGHYVEITEENAKNNVELGLWSFLKSLSFYVVFDTMETLLKLSPQNKQTLYNFMYEGIKEGVVKPFGHVIISPNDNCVKTTQKYENEFAKAIIRNVPREDDTCYNTGQKLICDSEHTYVIMGGSKKLHLWFEILEWLIGHGARKFILSIDNFVMSPKLNQRINKLIVNKKASIVLTSSQRADTLSDAAELIKESNKIAPLAAIFFVVMDEVGNRLQNVDVASRNFEPFHFVSVFSGGLKQCERRKYKGLPAFFIHADKMVEKLSEITACLRKLFSPEDPNSNVPFLYDVFDRRKIDSDNEDSVLKNYLPEGIAELESAGDAITKVPVFVEVSTLSVPHGQNKGVYPVYFIPAADGKKLENITRRLFYPAFFASLTESCYSATDVASQLAKNLQEIQPRGPVSIVGETWSGCVAIELASILQAKGRKVSLFLLEGSPFTWQKIIQSMGEANTPLFDDNLCKQIFNYRETVGIGGCGSWNENVDKFLSKIKCTDRRKGSIRKTVDAIRSRLLMAVRYAPRGQIIQHVVHIKQKAEETYRMEGYYVTDEIFIFEHEKYSDFTRDPDVSFYINDNAPFSWGW